MGGAYGLFRSIVEVIPEGRANLTLELQRRNKLTSAQHKKVPKLCWPKIPGQSQDCPPLMYLGVAQAIGADNFENQGHKTVHILSGSNAGPFSLVRAPQSSLLLTRRFTAFPESLDGFLRLPLIIYKIKWHIILHSLQQQPALLG